LSLAKQVTQKLAFELPAPFGPGVAKALGLLFGLSAGGDADTLGAVQAMLSKAVADLEDFMRGLKLEDKNGDARAFFVWASANIGPGIPGVPATSKDLEELIADLKDTKKFHPGTLFNDLVQITDGDEYVRSGESVPRSQDKALTFVIANLTAQFVAHKLIALVSAQMAAL
jgi:hypothetical protein